MRVLLHTAAQPRLSQTLQLLSRRARWISRCELQPTRYGDSCYWHYKHTHKIKFQRKGGWIRTFKNWNNPHLYKFGYGHPVLQLTPSTCRHRHKRYLSQHCIVWVYNTHVIPTNATQAVSVKPFNCYTKRGIRTSRFWLLKRKGKESKHAHLKSKIF